MPSKRGDTTLILPRTAIQKAGPHAERHQTKARGEPAAEADEQGAERSEEIEDEEVTITITKKAAIARINRKLRKECEYLHTLRGQRWWSDLGDHYVTNGRNHTVATHVDIESYARELGVLGQHEQVAR